MITGGVIDGGLGAIDLARFPDETTTTPKEDYGLTSAIELVSSASVKDVTFEGVKFINAIYNGIKDYGSLALGTAAERVTIKGCYFDNIHGNTIDGNFKDSLITENKVGLIGDIRAHTRGSFIIASCLNCVVSDNVIRQTTDSTIYIVGTGSGHTAVTGNTITYGGKDAIKFIASASNGTISGNQVIVAGKTSIGVFDDGISDHGSVSVTGNSCGYRVAPVILDPYTKYMTEMSINGCNIQNPKWVGLYETACISASASYCSVTANTISNPIGITISISEKGCVVSSNTVYFAAGPMVYCSSYGASIIGNVGFNLGQNPALVYNGIVDGIFITGSYAITITGNNLSIIEGKGVRVSSGSNILIASNSISKTKSDGIYADHQSSKVSIKGNNIDEAGGNGIYVNGVVGNYSNLNQITNNTILRSVSRGLWLRELSNALISANTIDGSGSDGIRLSDASKNIVLSNNIVNSNIADGIRLSDTFKFSVQGNSVSGNSRGIVVDSSCDGGVLLGNITDSNTTDYVVSGTNILPATIADFNV